MYLGLQAPARVFTELYVTAWFPSLRHAPSAALLLRTYISRVLESIQHIEVSLPEPYIRLPRSQRRLFFIPLNRPLKWNLRVNKNNGEVPTNGGSLYGCPTEVNSPGRIFCLKCNVRTLGILGLCST